MEAGIPRVQETPSIQIINTVGVKSHREEISLSRFHLQNHFASRSAD